MAHQFSRVILCILFVGFLGGAGLAADGDPVVGKWKFPRAVRILRADGSGTNEKGEKNATWKCLDVQGDRKYEITLDGGKTLLRLFLKNGGGVLEGANDGNHVHIVALRIHDQTPDNQNLVAVATPAPKPPPVAPPPTPAPKPPAAPAPKALTVDSFAPPDPVVGKWKFPKGNIRIFNADGSCSDGGGQVTPGVRWRDLHTANCEYEMTLGGKIKHQMVLTEGGAILKWADQPNAVLTALRMHDGTPDNQSFFVAPGGKPRATPPIDSSRPAIHSMMAGATIYHDVRPQAIHDGSVGFVYRENYQKPTASQNVPLSSLRYKDLVAIEEYNSAFSQEPALKQAKAAFYLKLTLKNGQAFTGVKVISELNGKLGLATDSGHASCTVDEVEPSDLKGLLATQTTEVLNANVALKAKDAARQAAIAATAQRKIAKGNSLDDVAANVPTGGLPVEYVRVMRKIGDPWTRDPAEAEKMPQRPPVEYFLYGFAALERGPNRALGDIIKPMQDRFVGLYQNLNDQSQRKALARTDDDIFPNRSAREHGGAFSRYNGMHGQIDGRSTVADEAEASTLFTDVVFNLAAETKGLEFEAMQERNRGLSALKSKLGEIYPPSPENREMLKVQLNPQGIEITNASGHTLTNLTVSLMLTHFAAPQRPREFRQIFVSNVENAKSVFLNANSVRSLWLPGWQKDLVRPEVATVWRGPEEHWLWGVGGTIAVEVTAYALEGHGTTTVNFPDNATGASLFELTNISRALGQGNDKDRDWALERARQVLAGVPPKSAAAAGARAILANPGAAAEKGRAMLLDILSSGLVGAYTCTTTLEPSTPNLETKNRIEAVNRSNIGIEGNHFVLDITRVTSDRQIEARIYPLGHPEKKRDFRGPAPALDLLKNRTTLLPVNGDPPPAADSAPAPVAATSVDIVVGRMKIEEGQIEGVLFAKVGGDLVRFKIGGARPRTRK